MNVYWSYRVIGLLGLTGCLPVATDRRLLGLAGGSGLGGGALAHGGLGGGHGAGHTAGGRGGGLVLLGEELELALLGNKASVTKALDSLQASVVLLLGNNAALVRSNEVRLDKATRGALCRAVKYLRLGANSDNLRGHIF